MTLRVDMLIAEDGAVKVRVIAGEALYAHAIIETGTLSFIYILR